MMCFMALQPLCGSGSCIMVAAVKWHCCTCRSSQLPFPRLLVKHNIVLHQAVVACNIPHHLCSHVREKLSRSSGKLLLQVPSMGMVTRNASQGKSSKSFGGAPKPMEVEDSKTSSCKSFSPTLASLSISLQNSTCYALTRLIGLS